MNRKGKAKETIDAGRRRHTGTTPGQRERAVGPQRRTGGSASSSSSSSPPIPPVTLPPTDYSGAGSSGGGFSSGGGTPLRLSAPVLIGIVVIVVILAVAGVFSGGENVPQEINEPVDEPISEPIFESTQEQAVNQVDQPYASSTYSELQAAPAVSAQSGQTWLVMLYQDADDKVLEQDIFLDLNEAERVGSSDRVRIIAQMDRFRAGYTGDGDWTNARRYEILKDDDFNKVNSQVVQQLGEVNMSDAQTLVDFVTWAVENYPADRHVLILSDHGIGWPGGWSDSEPKGSGPRGIPLAERIGDELYLMELDLALQQIRDQTGLPAFEVIGMDACLMGGLEVYTTLVPHARYAVASEEVEPALGWAYTGFLSELVKNPDMDGAQLSKLIVESYVSDDQRIVDDKARAEFLRQGSPLSALFGGLGVSEAQLSDQLSQNITLSAVDLGRMPELIDRVNDLAFALQNMPSASVARARSYAQSYTSVFGKEVPPSYLDLGHFIQLVQRETKDSQVNTVASAVLAALDQAVIAEKHGPKLPGSTGISIYFPNSDLYASPVTGPKSYTAIAERFAGVSLWDEYLAYHYTGRKFEPASGRVAIPTAPTTAPGAGTSSISPLNLSADSVAPGEQVTLSAEISGENIGYIYLFVGYYDPTSNSLFVADKDFLESADTRELNGVYYPQWSDRTTFDLRYTWEPIVFGLTDGVTTVTALLEPLSYGRTFEEAVYAVDGLYTFLDGGETRSARLLFTNGVLTQIISYAEEDGTGAARDIIPYEGDTFTLMEQWLDLAADGTITGISSIPGETLTFGPDVIQWVELDAAAGEYTLGFIVEDLDGNTTEVYTAITVR